MSAIYYQDNKGVTLVELMISQALGLMVIAALTGFLVPAISGFRHSNAISLIQESSRMAMDTLNVSIQQSGYRGCDSEVSYSSPIDSQNPTISRSLANWAYNNFGLRGYAADDAKTIGQLFGESWMRTRIKSGSKPVGDILLTRSASRDEIELVSHHPGNQTMRFRGNLTELISPGQIIEINDCSHAATFQIDQKNRPEYEASMDVTTIYYGSDQTINCSAVERNKDGLWTESGIVMLGGTGKGSCLDDASRAEFYSYRFAPGSMAHRVLTNAYYLARDPESTGSALYRTGFSANGTRSYSEAIVEGVENIRHLYGLDTNQDGSPELYRNATYLNLNPDTWHQVVSVRSWLTIRSIPSRGRSDFDSNIAFPDTLGNLIQCSAATLDQFQACPGSIARTKSDKHRMRRVYEKEFYLRNRMI